MIFSHDQDYDGQRLLLQTKKYLNEKSISSSADATEIPALGEDSSYHEILRENLLSHLRHAIHFFYSSKPNITIEEMVIAGDLRNNS